MNDQSPRTAPGALVTEPRMRVLYDAPTIQTRVGEMGLEIARDYDGKQPILIGVLKGAVMFLSDLARAAPIDLELDFVTLSSYGSGTTSSGSVRMASDTRNDIAGRHVLVCEGVVDSGLSLSFLLNTLSARKPASLQVAALLDKRPCRKIEVPVAYAGWRIGAEFVVGYGMDTAEKYRNLPYVGVIEEN